MYTFPTTIPEGAVYAFVVCPDTVDAVLAVQQTTGGNFGNDPVSNGTGLRGWCVPVEQLDAPTLTYLGSQQLLGVRIYFDQAGWDAWLADPSYPYPA